MSWHNRRQVLNVQLRRYYRGGPERPLSCKIVPYPALKNAKPALKRAAAESLQNSYKVSIRRSCRLRAKLPVPSRVSWNMDFIHDSLSNGRKFRVLTVVDQFSRECPVLGVDSSLSGEKVVKYLGMLNETRGLPKVITVDNGSEFTSKALDAWAYKNGVQLVE